MKKYSAKIFHTCDGEIISLEEYIITANSKDSAWEKALSLAFEVSLFRAGKMILLEEEVDIYDIF